MANRDSSLSKEITTEILKSNQVETTQITLSGLEITSNDGNLIIDSDEVACIKDVPKIIYLTQEEYDNLEQNNELDSDTYYYTTNEEIYITKTEFDQRIENLNSSIQTAINTISELKDQVLTLTEIVNSLTNNQ